MKMKNIRTLLAMPQGESSQQLTQQLESLQIHVDLATSLVEFIKALHKAEKYDLVVVLTNTPRMNYMEVASYVQNSLQNKPALVAVSQEYCLSEKRRCFAAGMQGYTASPNTDFWFEVIDQICLHKSANSQDLVPLFSIDKTSRMCQSYSQEHLDKFSNAFINQNKSSLSQIRQSMQFFDVKVVSEQLELIRTHSQQVGALAMLNAVEKTKNKLFFKPELEEALEHLQKIVELSNKKIKKVLVAQSQKQSVTA